MLKTIGIFLIKVIGKKGWELLSENDLDEILDIVFNDMSKESHRYNKILENPPLLLKEIFSQDEILKSVSDVLINEGELLTSENIDRIGKIIDKKQLTTQDIKEMLEDFQKHLILNITLNPKTRDKFLVTSVFYLSKTQKQILELLNEDIEIVGREDTGGFTDIGAITQFKILGFDFDNFIKEIEKIVKIKSSNRFLSLKKINDTEYQAVYQNKSSNKCIEITDSPFKIIYPNINKINVWFRKENKNNLEIIEITVFCSTPKIVNKLAYIFSSCIPSNSTIQQGNFHKKMKDFVQKKHHQSIYAIRFDPDITKKIKELGIPKEISVSEETFSGDPGLPQIDEIENIITNLNNLNTDGSSKIQFFKAKKDASLLQGILVTFCISSNGRLLGWFKKDQFDSEETKYKTLHKWYKANAEFNLLIPHKRKIN